MVGTATRCRSIAGSAARPASRTPARRCTARPPCTTSRRRRTPPTGSDPPSCEVEGKDELPGRPVPQLRHHPVGAGFVPETADRHAGRPRTVDARELGIGRAGWSRSQHAMYRRADRPGGGSLQTSRRSTARARLGRRPRRSACRSDTRSTGGSCRRSRAEGRASPSPMSRRPTPPRTGPDRVPAARRADGDAPLRHRARKSTEDGLGDGDGNRDGLRRDRGDRPGGDQREDGDTRDDQQPTIASPPRCADLVAVLRDRRLLPTTDPLPQAHGAIMQLSNADSGLIVVAPSGVFMFSGPTSDAGASAVKQP